MPLDGAVIVDQAWSAGWKPDPPRTVSEWADENRRLPREGASEHGQWRTSRTPYLREIMDALSPHHPAREVVMMSSTQVGKTEVILNWIGETIEWDPAPMLVVQPTTNVAKRWSKQRFAGMIRETPSLRRLVSPVKSRDSGNTTLMKEYPGGVVVVGGANSAPDLSSMPIKKLALDEIDRYPYDLENEGDPVMLAERRTSTFPRRKIFKCSSPTIESLSRINKAYEDSDQRHYWVPCPHCKAKQVLDWGNLRWIEGKHETAAYACSVDGCGALIEEHHKTWMLESGEWRAAKQGRAVVGFHLNALYTPIGLGESWAELATLFDKVKSDPTKRKVFENTVEGICSKDPGEKLDWQVLQARAAAHAVRTVPSGCLVLTVGVDVQGNRLSVQLVGWGRDHRSWPLDWVELPGDPTQQAVWEKLDEYLAQPIVNGFGVQMRPAAVAVDSRYLKDAVLRYTRARRNRNVFAMQGEHSLSKTILSSATKPDKNRRGRTSKRSVDVWMVNSSACKEFLFLRLKDDGERAREQHMVVFPADLPEEYYTQLTAEIYDPRKRLWVKQQARNEGLDTWCYALAATYHPNVRVHVFKEADWLKLESVLEPQMRDLLAQAAEPTPAPVAVNTYPPEEGQQPANPAGSSGDWIEPRPDWLR